MVAWCHRFDALARIDHPTNHINFIFLGTMNKIDQKPLLARFGQMLRKSDRPSSNHI